MAIFMVSYDLHKDKDYEKLTDALEKYPSYWHCLNSTWLILSDDTATEIKQNLRRHILKRRQIARDALRKNSAGQRRKCILVRV